MKPRDAVAQDGGLPRENSDPRHKANLSQPAGKIDEHSPSATKGIKDVVKGERAEPPDSRLGGKEIDAKGGQRTGVTADGAHKEVPRADTPKTKVADTQEPPTKKTGRADGEPGSSKTEAGTKGPRNIDDVDFIVGDRKGMAPFGGRGANVPSPDSIFENIGGKKSGKGKGDTKTGDANENW